MKLFKGGLILSFFALCIYFYNSALLPNSTVDSNQYSQLNLSKENIPEIENVSVNSPRQADITDETTSDFTISNNKLTVETTNTQKTIQQANSQYDEQEKMNIALSQIPINYHTLLKWSGGEDSELINEYITLNETPENEVIDNDLETLLSTFIYQHEMNPNIQVERLNCSQTSCEIYGTESGSNTWNTIKESGKNQTWWTFTKETTRNGVGVDGELIFLTIIQK